MLAKKMESSRSFIGCPKTGSAGLGILQWNVMGLRFWLHTPSGDHTLTKSHVSIDSNLCQLNLFLCGENKSADGDS